MPWRRGWQWRPSGPANNITAANGKDAPLVINDTEGNSFALWQYTENGAANSDTDAVTDLTLIGIFNGNGAVATGNLDLV